MKANKLFAVLIPLFVLSTTLSSDALAQRHFGRHHAPMFKLDRLADELELTEEQEATLEEQEFAAGKAAIELRSRLQMARLELHKLMRADTPDEGEIKSTVEEMGKLRTERHLRRIQRHLSMLEVLTPEQKEKLQSLRKQCRGHHRREFRHREEDRMFRNFQGRLGEDDFGLDPEDEGLPYF